MSVARDLGGGDDGVESALDKSSTTTHAPIGMGRDDEGGQQTKGQGSDVV